MKKLIVGAALLLGLCLFASAAAADDGAPPNLMPAFDLFYQTYLYAANDIDFDRTKVMYQPNGQTVGYVLTTIRPGLTWTPADILTVRYQFEVGDNIWSRNDVYNDNPNTQDATVFRQKEIWADLHTPSGSVGTRIGYMYTYDPTHLVLDAHMGMAQLYFGFGGGKRLTLEAGQLPVDTLEQNSPDSQGARLQDNTFANQNYIFAAYATLPLGAAVLSPGVFFNANGWVIDRPVNVASAVCNFTYNPAANMNLNLDGVFQYGKEVHAALDNSDVTLVAGAAQANFSVDWPVVGLRTSALAFSGGDHNREGRRLDTGFMYSGWSRADTMMMTINWLHDLYTNFDQTVAAEGAGFALIDQRVSVDVGGDADLFAIVGAGFTMSHADTGNSNYFGTEGQIGVQWSPLPNHLRLHLIAGGMLPGRAASELINTINKKAQDPIVQGQAGITVLYGNVPWFGVK
jgi:opacity protein-like surface antigen